MAVILSYNFPVLFTSSRFIIAIILIHFFLYPFANSVHFQVSRFSHDQHNIIYQGDAVTFAGTIELNRVDYMNRIGQVVYAGNVPIWDSNSGKVSDFTTHFSIIIDTQNLSDYGHGLAFFLAPVGFQIPLNSAGGFLGLFNTSNFINSSINHIVLVEFDSLSNPEWDPPFEHVGINNNSISSSIVTPWNVTLHTGEIADSWIIYNATTKN